MRLGSEEERHAAPLSEREDQLQVKIAQLEAQVQGLEGKISRLSESRGRFEAVLGAMREGVIALDPVHRVRFANPSAVKILGWHHTPTGERIEDHLGEESLIHFLQERTAEDAPWVELDFKNKRTILVQLTAQSKRGEEVLVLSDITALRRLETVRRDFVANVSHELRTPTTVIQANAETLLDGAIEEPALALTFLEGIHRNAQRLAHLVSDLLDLSRIESGTYRLQGEEIDPKEVVTRVVDTLADQIIAKQIEVTIDLQSDHPVIADAGALEQIFTNLIENAVSYSQERGQISIHAIRDMPEATQARTQRFIRFQVIDDGPGISQKHQARIFERFYRVDKGRARQLGGTGLGLSIVKHLCGAMGGEVGLESELGSGCCFWFTIPLESRPTPLEVSTS
ncbi:MAG: ATP-binding protein [Myxococcota bacterium]|nr:ATP-binding protein [Myxococcota bacterium]